MALPLTSANVTKLRTANHAAQFYLTVYHPAIIWTATVSGTYARGATAITVTSVVSVKTPVRNYLVAFGSTAGGNDLGIARFKSYSSGTLTIGANQVTPTNGCFVSILEEIKPSSIIPKVTFSGVVSEDGDIAYTNQNLTLPPLARFGPPAVGILSSGTVTLSFYSNSTVMQGGASLSSCLWTFPNGSPGTSTSFGSVGSPVTVSWTQAGQYYVSLQVTDSNGQTHTSYRPVFILDLSDHTQYYDNIEIDNLSGAADGSGWSCNIKVNSQASPAEFPNNALVVVSSIDYYDGVADTIADGYTYRENIVYAGYVRQDSVHKNWETGTVEFESAGIGGIMGNLLAWPANLKLAGTPAAWHQIPNMTCDLAAYHILSQHSTITQICDVDLNTPPYLLKYVDITESPLRAQLGDQLYTANRSRIGSNRQGMLFARVNPQIDLQANRTQSITLDVTFDDLAETLDLAPEPHEKKTAQVDFIGFKYGTDPQGNPSIDPVYSLAPGQQWPTGSVDRVDGIRADTQDEANNLAGLFEGYKNNPFSDVNLVFRGNYRVFDVFPPYKITLTLTPSQTNRGLSWNAAVFWPKQVSISYKSQIVSVTVTAEKDSFGAAGITGNYPTTSPTLPPPGPTIIYKPPPTPPKPPPTVTRPQGKGNLLYVSSLKGVAKCVNAYGTNGSNGTPTWTAINTGLTGNALKVRWFNLDPWSHSGDHFTAAWALTDDGLYRCTGLPNAASWTQQLSPAAAQTLIGSATIPKLAWAFAASVLTAGYVAVCISPNEAGLNGRGMVYYAWSTDYGATWNVTTRPIGVVGIPVAVQSIRMECSFHVSGRYFLDGPFGIRAGYTDADVWNGSLYETGHHLDAVYLKDPVTGRMYGFCTYQGNTGPGASLYLPYCNNAGTPYATDDVGYTYGSDHTGTGAIRRYTTFESPLWRPGVADDFRAYTSIGDAAMGGLAWFFTNMFNEDYGVAIDGANIWLTSNQGSSWTRKNAPAIGGRTFSPTYEFMIPVDPKIVFFTGKATGGGGVAQVVMTPDFGTTLTDITNHGGANDLDTVLGLVPGDVDGSLIVIDYYKV